ncbi:MAG: TonB-dependent receptor [Candidatus Omnitrophica bacterium]|nr:TonB-dependent receptor [Candidatus Omnitrophota bacterium]
MRNFLFSVFSVLFFSFNLCLAENSHRVGGNQEMIRLEEIVITPYKVAIGSFQSPASTKTISVEEAQAKGIFGLKEAIKDLPSLSFKSSGIEGGDTSFFIRGAKSDHTQVLLDGVKLFDPQSTSGYFYAYGYMSLDNLEKIEVTKGPYSTLYGSDSIGGTINLITKKGEGKPSFSYTQEFGSYQTAREKLSSDGEIGKLAYSFSVSRKDVNHAYAGKYKDGNHETDPYHGLNSSLRLDYSLSQNTDIGLITNYTYAKYEYDGWGGVDDLDNYAYFYQGVGAINLKQKVNSDFSHKITLGYTRSYRKYWESSSASGWYDGITYQAKWQGDYKIIENDRIVFGFDYLKEKGNDYSYSTRNPKQTANTKGYYLENIFTPLDNLFFSASFRTEDHSSFGIHNTFSLSGSYTFKPTATTIKASFGEGFKAPSLYQLYNGTYGNSNLDPEESESWEVGLEQKIGKRLTLGSTYFHTQIKEMLDTVGTWPNFEYQNVGKAQIWGIENLLNYDFNKNTKLSIHYTYLNTEDKSDGTRLFYRPENKVLVKFETKLKKLKISPSISYIGNRIVSSTVKLKSYILANLSFNYQVNDQLNTFLRFENILDDDYELVDGYQTPEFSWYLGAKYTF